MLPTIISLFNAFRISCVKLNIAFSVDKFLLKPNCWGFNRLLLFKWSINLLYRAFSITFENDVNNDIGQ
jgi:hypothetical protein